MIAARHARRRFVRCLAVPLAASLIAGVCIAAAWMGAPQLSGLGFAPTKGAPVPAGAPLRLAALAPAPASSTVERRVGQLLRSRHPHLVLDIGATLPARTGGGRPVPDPAGQVPAWVRQFRSITDPVLGGSARAAAGDTGRQSWNYSFDAHGWHIAVVDSTTADFASGAASGTYRWLQADLAAARSRCILVAADAPLLALDPTGATYGSTSYWRLLTRYRVTTVLGGRAHNYQRWQRLDGAGRASRTGPTQFVVGTAGNGIDRFGGRDNRMAAGRDTPDDARGVLLLDLGSAGATFRFETIDGRTLDYGSTSCTGAADRTAPSAASALTATARSGSRVQVRWRPAVDDVGVTSYQVLRDGTPIGTVAGYRTAFTDATVLSRTRYRYAVIARDAAGNRAPRSSAVTVTTPSGPPVFRQAVATSTGGRVTSTTLRLAAPVRAGELLVGWFGQYDSAGQVRLSDDRGWRWSRIRGEWFRPGAGDVALFYTFAASAAPNGVTVTVRGSSRTYLQAVVAAYWGLARGRPVVSASVAGGAGRVADSGATRLVARGSLVFAALMTGGVPHLTIAGRSAGVALIPRAATDTGSVSAADVTSARAGPQRAVFRLVSGTDWRAGVAVFRAAADPDTTPPAVPVAVTASGDPVVVHWAAARDRDLAGFDVYRDGVKVGAAGPDDLAFTDSSAAPSTRYGYTVVAVDSVGNRSAPSSAAAITTLPPAPVLIQAGVIATPRRVGSVRLRLARPVAAGDLLVGWFAQYDAGGPVRVSDQVNGAWTPLRGLRFADGHGDIELFAVRSAVGRSGLMVSVSASAATYLQGGVVEYRPRSAISLASSSVNSGASAVADSAASAPAPAGALVVSGLITGWQPRGAAPEPSAGVQPDVRTATNSGSVILADIRSGRAGIQRGRFRLGGAGTWYAMCVVFRR